jgi:hypothetical protein
LAIELLISNEITHRPRKKNPVDAFQIFFLNCAWQTGAMLKASETHGKSICKCPGENDVRCEAGGGKTCCYDSHVELVRMLAFAHEQRWLQCEWDLGA